MAPGRGRQEVSDAHTVPAVAAGALRVLPSVCRDSHVARHPQEKPSSDRGWASKGGSETEIPWCSFSSENFICQAEAGGVRASRSVAHPHLQQRGLPAPGHFVRRAEPCCTLLSFPQAAEDRPSVHLGPRWPGFKSWLYYLLSDLG